MKRLWEKIIELTCYLALELQTKNMNFIVSNKSMPHVYYWARGNEAWSEIILKTVACSILVKVKDGLEPDTMPLNSFICLSVEKSGRERIDLRERQRQRVWTVWFWFGHALFNFHGPLYTWIWGIVGQTQNVVSYLLWLLPSCQAFHTDFKCICIIMYYIIFYLSDLCKNYIPPLRREYFSPFLLFFALFVIYLFLLFGGCGGVKWVECHV